MRKLLTSRAFWHWVGLISCFLVLSLLNWFLGPFISISGYAPLANLLPLVLVQGVLVLVFILASVWLWRRRKTGVVTGSAAVPVQGSPDAARAAQDIRTEIAAMTLGFQRALDVLKRMRDGRKLGRAYAYQLPWYLVMGPIGSGKSELIRHSGLRFPMSERKGGKIEAGAHASFMFSDKAVLVDTEGPFRGDGVLTGDARQIWTGFIDQLKTARSRQPINGVLLVLNLETFARWDDVERVTRAADIRQQLVGLQASLKMRFPVYLVFTGLDRVPGFSAFFEGLSSEERARVFGLTFPFVEEVAAEQDDDAFIAFFNREFTHLLQWQRPRTLSRVNAEPDTQRRLGAFMFLPHLAALRPMISDFLEDVFKSSRYERALLLRGTYFTSANIAEDATETSPARLLQKDQAKGLATGSGGGSSSASAKEPGSELVRDPASRPSITDRLRSGYFIRDMLEKVIFEEAGLVGVDSEVKRRQSFLQWSLTALVAALGLCFTLWWTVSFLANQELISRVERATHNAEQVIRPIVDGIESSPDNALDLPSTVPALRVLAALPTGWDERNKDLSLALSGGLSQVSTLSEATQAEYRDGQIIFLLPRLQTMLQQKIVAEISDPHDLYDALMVYLMMGGEAPVDKNIVSRWMREEFVRLYPGPAQATLRAALNEQVSNLLEAGFPPIELDGKLVQEARAVLNQYPPSQRGLAILARLPEVEALRPWRLSDAAGPLASYALVRRSGNSLSETIDGMYMADNFYTVILPAITKVAETLVNEDWVRSPRTTGEETILQASALRQEMVELFANTYISQWENLLSDVTIASFSTLQQEVSILKAVAGPPSPLKSYLTSVAQQTSLTPPAEAKEDNSIAGIARQELQGSLTNAVPPGQPITDHFASLREFVEGTSNPLDEVIKQLVQLRIVVGPAASADVASSAQITELTSGPAFTQILSQLRLSTLSAPPALGDSILALVRETSNIANAGLQADMNSTWQAQVLPFCTAAINGRYPVANSRQDITIADFSRFFAPSGLLDQFFERQLKPFIDTSISPWKVMNTTGMQLNITPAALGYFEQAARIRAMFFPGGAATPQLIFEVTPIDLDPGALRVKLDIDGQALIYQYGPPQQVAMKWPASTGGVRVEFGAQEPGFASSLTVPGPWALLRFVRSSDLRRLSADRFSFRVSLGARSAGFTLNATSVDNPFGQNPLLGFRCLPSLASQ